MEGLALIGIALILAGVFATTPFGPAQSVASENPPAEPEAQGGVETLVVAGGCFWCLEPLFEKLIGVGKVEVGYAGGDPAGVTYEQVLTGLTGHAEALKITFDPKAITGEDVLRLFFTMHDPTTLNRQGNDVGPQYRSAVFFSREPEKARAEKIMKEIADAKIWGAPLVTTLEPLRNYTRAEEYHQDYYEKFENATPDQRAGMNSAYCQAIIAPKVREFRKKFAHLLKP